MSQIGNLASNEAPSNPPQVFLVHGEMPALSGLQARLLKRLRGIFFRIDGLHGSV